MSAMPPSRALHFVQMFELLLSAHEHLRERQVVGPRRLRQWLRIQRRERLEAASCSIPGCACFGHLALLAWRCRVPAAAIILRCPAPGGQKMPAVEAPGERQSLFTPGQVERLPPTEARTGALAFVCARHGALLDVEH